MKTTAIMGTGTQADSMGFQNPVLDSSRESSKAGLLLSRFLPCVPKPFKSSILYKAISKNFLDIFGVKTSFSTESPHKIFLENSMQYTLITSTGKILLFTVKSCADIYLSLYGGVVITQQVLDKTEKSVIMKNDLTEMVSI